MNRLHSGWVLNIWLEYFQSLFWRDESEIEGPSWFASALIQAHCTCNIFKFWKQDTLNSCWQFQVVRDTFLGSEIESSRTFSKRKNGIPLAFEICRSHRTVWSAPTATEPQRITMISRRAIFSFRICSISIRTWMSENDLQSCCEPCWRGSARLCFFFGRSSLSHAL